MKRTLTVAEFVRLHGEQMAAFAANDCEQSDEWDAKNAWYLSDALNAAYAAIEETSDNHPDFVLEWDDGQDATEAYARRLRAIGHNATYCLSDCVDRTDSYLVEFDALALVLLDNGHPDKWLWSNMWQKQCLYRWNSDVGDYHIAH